MRTPRHHKQQPPRRTVWCAALAVCCAVVLLQADLVAEGNLRAAVRGGSALRGGDAGQAGRVRAGASRPVPAVRVPTTQQPTARVPAAQQPASQDNPGAVREPKSPIGAPNFIIELDPAQIAIAPTDTLWLYRATVPVTVTVAAQRPRWEVLCRAERLSAPGGVAFQPGQVFMAGAPDAAKRSNSGTGHGTAPVNRSGVRVGSGAQPRAAVSGKDMGFDDAVPLDTLRFVGSGTQTGHQFVHVADLVFYVHLDPFSAAGSYAFTIQFYGAQPGASGPFRGPALELGFRAEPVTSIQIDTGTMDFGAVGHGEHLSRNEPLVHVLTNQEIDVQLIMHAPQHQDNAATIETERLALGLGTTRADAEADAHAAPLGQVSRVLSLGPGATDFYLRGKAAVDAALHHGAYEGSITVQVTGAS